MVNALIFLFIVLIGCLLGVFLYTAPSMAIELQKKFYRSLNWNIEPISMEKEIKNTKRMGSFLVIFVAICCVYYFLLN